MKSLLAALSLSLALALLVAGCNYRTSSNVYYNDRDPVPAGDSTAVERIVVTRDDVTDRKYEKIAEIEATVSKGSPLEPNPTEAMVAEALKETAAPLGADAVIKVRYGPVTLGTFTFARMKGTGTAVRFLE